MVCRAAWVLIGVALFAQAAAVAAEAQEQEEAAIRAAAKQYVEALAQGDVKALEALWAPNGQLVDEFGRAISAEQLIAQEGQVRANASEETSHPKVEVTDSAIQFVTPDVALEDGLVNVVPPGGNLPPTRGKYLAVWVKSEGRWRLASLREARMPGTPSDGLATLDWMIGDWTGQLGKAQFNVSVHWNAKHTYIERDLTVTHDGQEVLSGQQRIGIDPLDGQVRSWMHDSDGGHGEGLWSRHGDAWVVQAHGVSPDGAANSATNVYTRVSNDRVLWKSTSGFSNGQSVPDFAIELKRVTAGE